MERFKPSYRRFHSKDYHKFQALKSKKTCPLPDDLNEANRLYALHSTELMDSDVNDPMFDRFASLAMRVFDVPMVMITFVDVDRVFCKSNIGILEDDPSSYPREYSFDAHVVLPDQSDVFIVEDTHEEDHFQRLPLVVSNPHVRFYAAAVLMSDEQKVGTLSLMDTTPKQMSYKDQMNLLDIGVSVSGIIKERRNISHNVSKLLATSMSHTLASFQLPVANFVSAIAKLPPLTVDSTVISNQHINNHGNNVDTMITTSTAEATRSHLSYGMDQFRLAMEVSIHPSTYIAVDLTPTITSPLLSLLYCTLHYYTLPYSTLLCS